MTMESSVTPKTRAQKIADRVEQFVREVVIPYERDPRSGPHGPTEELVREMRTKARAAGVLTPHILPDGSQLTQRETALVLKRSGLSTLYRTSVVVGKRVSVRIDLGGRRNIKQKKDTKRK